ncbi:hypothetical protein TWF225_002829 [Orbilia oligospora]|nr:hypothetical protein TWF751_004009 [Orbilia oligospora]KAF3189694.1 hypothetical protein TWF225_002829 [Orbilia oligospora]KAF3249399.1 hypothetical protein TWF128_007829 [Orbilia oligospora]KAF3263807.1 hypothetical protein TWF217_003514 [Orbilia oligospora]
MPDNSQQSSSKRPRCARNVEPLPAAPTPMDLPLQSMAKSPILCTSSQEINAANNVMESDVDSSASLPVETPSLSEQSIIANPELLEGPMNSKANDIADGSNGRESQLENEETKIARLEKDHNDAELEKSLLRKEQAELKKKLEDAELEISLLRKKQAGLKKKMEDVELELSLCQKKLWDAEFDSETWRDKARAQNRDLSSTKQLLTAPHTPDD